MELFSDIINLVTDFFSNPPEPLVLGAELWCPYGSERSFLMLEGNDFDIENLPQACVDDCKAFVNIFPFGECAAGKLCEYKMELEKQWENPEPQTEIANGKEVITTKSVLMCNAEGMEIQAASSGQEFGKKLAEQLNLKAKMDAKYPGLYDLLMDPYGSLYLNEGMFQNALAFLKDQIKDRGDIFLPAIFDGDDLKNEMVRLALGRLMPRCDISTYDRFINGLEDTGLLTGMNEKKGWDVHYLNDKMMEMLWKDCIETDKKIKTDPEFRWQEENRIFTSFMSDAMTQLSKAVVLYLAMQAEPTEKTGKKTGKKTGEKTGTEKRKKAETKTGEKIQNTKTKQADTVTYRRVQGGTGNKRSRFRIKVNADGTISIPNKTANLNISADTGEHASYFLKKRGGNAQIVEVDVPKWFDDFLQENAISQVNYKKNILNQVFRFLPIRIAKQGILLPVHNKCGETCLPRQSCRRNKACLVPVSYP